MSLLFYRRKCDGARGLMAVRPRSFRRVSARRRQRPPPATHLRVGANRRPRCRKPADGLPIPLKFPFWRGLSAGRHCRRVRRWRRRATPPPMSAEEDADDGRARGGHACDICGRVFSRPLNMRAHRETHSSGPKAFACPDCGTSFRRVYELRRHQRNGSCRAGGGQTSAPGFACDRCGNVFSRNDALIRHLRRSDKRPCAAWAGKYVGKMGTTGRGRRSGGSESPEHDGQGASEGEEAVQGWQGDDGHRAGDRESEEDSGGPSAGEDDEGDADDGDYGSCKRAKGRRKASAPAPKRRAPARPASDRRPAPSAAAMPAPVAPPTLPSPQAPTQALPQSPPMARASFPDPIASVMRNMWTGQQANGTQQQYPPPHLAAAVDRHPMALLGSSAVPPYPPAQHPAPHLPLQAHYPEPFRPPLPPQAYYVGGTAGAPAYRTPPLHPLALHPQLSPFPGYAPSPAFANSPYPASPASSHAPTPMDLLALAASPYPGVGDAPPAAPAAPRNALHDLYPTIPPHVLPPWPLVDAMIATHRRYEAVIHHLVHYPTFRLRASRGQASPGVLACMMWGSLRALDTEGPSAEGWTWTSVTGVAFREDLESFCLAWLEAESAACAEDGDVPLERLAQLARAFSYARSAAQASGLREATERCYRELGLLFPLLRFGTEPEDLGPRPSDPAAWIRYEERARLCAYLAYTDIVAADLLDWPTRVVPETGLRLAPDGSYELPWANLPAPCHDEVFENFPASGTPPGVSAPGGPLPVGAYFSWMDLDRNDPARKSFLRAAVAGIMPAGCTASIALVTGVWARQRRVKLAFAAKGLPFHDPGDDAEAAALRDRVVACIEEVWENLPAEVRRLDEAADGEGLRAFAVAGWGKDKGDHLSHFLVFMHTFDLILHSPYDLLLGASASHPPPTPSLESWPFTPAFVRASAHAIAASRLIKSVITSGPGGRPDVRVLPAVWTLAVLRTCWVHVISIRRLRHVLRTVQLPEPSMESALAMLLSLLADVQSAVSGLSELGRVWRHTRGAFGVVNGLLEREQGDGEASGVWVTLTDEEAAVVKGIVG